MKKRIISLILISSVLNMLFAATALASSPYLDVPETHTNYPAILDMFNKGIMTGIGGKFYPDLNLTRCELLKVSYVSTGVTPPVAPGQAFPDIPTTHWCNDYANDAKNKGYIQGYSDGMFRPNQYVIVIEAQKMLLNLHGVTLPTVTSDLYDDVQVGDWWARYVKFSIDHNLVTAPTGANYGIHNNFPRKMTAQYIYMLLIYKSQPHY